MRPHTAGVIGWCFRAGNNATSSNSIFVFCQQLRLLSEKRLVVVHEKDVLGQTDT